MNGAMNGNVEKTKYGDAPSATDIPSINPSESTSAESTQQDLVTKGLQFLSTASTETIGGIAVGLAACTYLVLGRVGLVLIGVVGGVVLHATWENPSAGSVEEARKEKSLDIVKRILELRNADTLAMKERQQEVLGNTFEGFQPETALALNELVDAVIRDYVQWWYNPILPKEISFPLASRNTLTRFILSISHHLSRKRPADSFLDFLTNSSSTVIVFLNELAYALTPSQSTNTRPAESVYTYLSENPESSLANILNEQQQSKKFNMIAEDMLQNFLDKQTYDCEPARTFLREILAGVVLEMTLKSISKPEWINGWIVYLLEEGEPDFNQAIDAGMKNDVLNSPFNDFDGNVGNVGLAKPSKLQRDSQNKEVQRHKKRLSKAEEAMEEAMEEAKRLSQLIAEEDAKKIKDSQKSSDLKAAVEENARSMEANAAIISKDLQASSSKAGAEPSQRQAQVDQTQPLTPIQNGGHAAAQSSQIPEAAKAPTSPETPIRNGHESPISPHSAKPTSSGGQVEKRNTFTSFDQIVPQTTPVALQDGSAPRRKTVSLTLHNAVVTIYDDSTPSDLGKLRGKPTGDYLLQIEPSSSQHPGWMIVRRYHDFETLHEVLRRIAQISGVTAFTEQHHTLPPWKDHTKASLRGELERYLRDALWYQPLAESEGMKRFLEKDNAQSAPGAKNSGIGWPTPSAFESMGKGMLDVLASAPKGVAEGGKAIGGGITGVFTNIGNLTQKKQSISSVSNVATHTAARASTSTLPRMDSTTSLNGKEIPLSGTRKGRASEDSLRPAIVQTQPSMIAPMERRPSRQSIAEDEAEREPRVSSARSSMSGRRSATQSRDPSRAPSRLATPLSSPTHNILEDFRLPPPPSDISDDYTSPDSATYSRIDGSAPTARTSTSTAPSQMSPGRPSLSGSRRSSIPSIQQVNQQVPRKSRKEAAPLSEPETRVAVELLFAVINELYTLSSAWTIRRTLLNAAKTFLLRPGNPSLSSIQSLIQESVIAANTSDAGIASHLRKLRENTLPTEDEQKTWPAEMSSEEKERLRLKARKLFVERGVPVALTGVMGNAATGEAMGKVFDCLQVEEIARGLMFGLLLQFARAVAH